MMNELILTADTTGLPRRLIGHRARRLFLLAGLSF
jgi:hypothetical protein